MSSEARSRFAERANIAQERRHQVAMKERQHNSSVKNALHKAPKKNQKSQRNLSYWLVSASLKEIFTRLFWGKSKHI